MITVSDLQGNHSQEKLKELYEYTNGGKKLPILTRFFLDTMGEKERGLAGVILNKLQGNPFGTVSERTINRWLDGKTKIDRDSAYQICIAFNLGLNDSELFFKDNVYTDFVRFSDWHEILYHYCIKKGYNLDETYSLYEECVNKGLEKEESEVSHRGHTTKYIKNAYFEENFINDEVFIKFLEANREGFHRIRITRRREVIEIINKFEERHGHKYLINLFAGAFFEDDNDDSNFDYFGDVLSDIKNSKQNFSREFLILCLLIKGMNSWRDIEEYLTREYIDWTCLELDIMFDACVFEACEYYECTKGTDDEMSAYDRFCVNTLFLEYRRPEEFAYQEKIQYPKKEKSDSTTPK